MPTQSARFFKETFSLLQKKFSLPQKNFSAKEKNGFSEHPPTRPPTLPAKPPPHTLRSWGEMLKRLKYLVSWEERRNFANWACAHAYEPAANTTNKNNDSKHKSDFGMKKLLPLFIAITIGTSTAAPADESSLFVYGTDGSLSVFPTRYILSDTRTADMLTLTLEGDTVINIPMSSIDSITDSAPQLPVMTSFKFNNKFNPDLVYDVEPIFVDGVVPRELDLEVPVIGKRLTPSFKLSDENAAAYVDGERQESKVSRLRFDKDITYTVTYPGWNIYSRTKLTDEVWSEPQESRWQELTLTADMLSTNQESNLDNETSDKMLDDNEETYFQSRYGTGQLQEYVHIDIALPHALNQFKLFYQTWNRSSNYNITELKISASNDGTNWTDITTLTARDNGLPTKDTGGGGQKYTSDPIQLGKNYSHLRLTATNGEKTPSNGNPLPYYVAWAEMRILEYIQSDEQPVLIQPATYTSQMKPYGTDYSIRVDFLSEVSDVPRIDIWTDYGVLPYDRTTWLKGYFRLTGNGMYDDLEDSISIRGRGNSSWAGMWGKSPYNIKFGVKQKPFGLTKGKKWCLIANAQRGSMMANAIGMKAARMVGTDGANHVVPVELYINDEYRGSYTFTEKVGISNNSIDIDETTSVLLELDSYFDETYRFYSTPFSLPTNIKDPDLDDEEWIDKADETFRIYKEEFNDFCYAVYHNSGFERMMDVESFAKFFMVNDLINNMELGHPKSTFLYKEGLQSLNAKYHFGPVWDLDWAFGYENSSRYYLNDATTDLLHTKMKGQAGDNFFYALRYSSDDVKREYYTVWKDFVDNHLEELLEYAQDYFDFAHPSFEHNNSLWGDGSNYASSIRNIRTWLTNRTKYIMSNIDVYDPSGDGKSKGDVNGDGFLSASDVVCLINYLLGHEDDDFTFENADVDENGNITVTDLVWVIHFLTEAGVTLSPYRMPPAELRLYMDGFEATLGENTTVDVNILPVEEADESVTYTACSFDVVVPEGITLKDITACSGTHTVSFTHDGEQTTHVLVYSNSNAPLTTNDQLRLKINTQSVVEEKARAIAITNASVVTTDGEDHRMAGSTKHFDLRTGVDAMLANIRIAGGKQLTITAIEPTHVEIFSAEGMLQREMDVPVGTTIVELPSGIYIVNGTKTVIY